jgi:hypothetical protein
LSDPLLVAYAVGGGIPPATYETLRVYVDGTARAVVGNAWPLGSPQDEAGTYEHRVADLAPLREPIAGDFGPLGEPTADSGRCELRLGEGRRAVWPMNDPPPPALAPLVERMRALLAETRRHPLGAVALSLAAAGDSLELTLHNPGREPVGIEGGEFRLRATPVEGEVGGRPDLESLVTGDPLALGPLPDALAPGERRTLTASATPGRLDVYARLTADLPYEGERLRLECVLLAGPLVVTGGG